MKQRNKNRQRQSTPVKDDIPFIYGIHAVAAVVERRPDHVKEVWIQKNFSNPRLDTLRDKIRRLGIAVSNLEADKLDEMAQGERHQGIIARFSGGALWSEGDLKPLLDSLDEHPFLLVLDGVTDPHNLGACLRAANGAGVHAVIAPKDKAVGVTSVVRKVACGAAETTPFIPVTNLSRTLRELQTEGVWVVGLADEEDGCLYDSRLSGPLALVMGAEGKGLRRLTRENCDEILALPMAGSVSSLNVSVAAGVCVYEVLRQRRAMEKK